MGISSRKLRRNTGAAPGALDDPNTVRVNGSATYALTGTNIVRDTSQLIRYTRTATQTVTPTNMYGVEVVVSLSNNQVVSVNNRVGNNDATGTTIAAGTYVLSGHGIGSGYAGQWLLDNASVGTSIELLTIITDLKNFTASSPSTTEVQLSWQYTGATLTNFTLMRGATVIASPAAGNRSYTDTGLSANTSYTYTLTGNYQAGGATVSLQASCTTQSGSSGGSNKSMIMWHNGWELPLIRNYPAAVRSNLTQISLGMAQSGGSGTGLIQYTPSQPVADHAADIAAFRNLGKDVVLGVGGAGSGGISVQNSSQAQQMVSSFKNIVSAYSSNGVGINGIDIDLEPGSSSWNNAGLVEVCTSLRSFYGSSFVIGVTTSLYYPHDAAWMSFLNALGHSTYNYTGPMLYDFPESTDSRLTGVTLGKADYMSQNGVPDQKMVFGFMLQPNAGYNASPNVGVINNAYNAVKAQRPNIQGAYFWVQQIDANRNWEWTLGAYSSIFN